MKSRAFDYEKYVRRPKYLNPLEAPAKGNLKKRKKRRRKSLRNDDNGRKFDETNGARFNEVCSSDDEEDDENSTPKVPPLNLVAVSRPPSNDGVNSPNANNKELDASPISSAGSEINTGTESCKTNNENHDSEILNTNLSNMPADEIIQEAFSKEYEYQTTNMRRQKNFDEFDEDEKIQFYKSHYHLTAEQIQELRFHPEVNKTQLINKTYTGINLNSPSQLKPDLVKKLKSPVKNFKRKVSVTPSHQRKDFMLSQQQGSIYYHMKDVYESSARSHSEKGFYEKLLKLRAEEYKRQCESVREKETKRRDSMLRQRDQLKQVRDKYELHSWRRFMTQYVASRVTDAEGVSRKEYGLPESLEINFKERHISVKSHSKPSIEKAGKKKYDSLFSMTPRPVWKQEGEPLRFEGFDSVFLEGEDNNGQTERQRVIVKQMLEEANMLLQNMENTGEDIDIRIHGKEGKENATKRKDYTSTPAKIGKESQSPYSLPESRLPLSNRSDAKHSYNTNKKASLLKRHSCPVLDSSDKTKNWMNNRHSDAFTCGRNREIKLPKLERKETESQVTERKRNETPRGTSQHQYTEHAYKLKQTPDRYNHENGQTTPKHKNVDRGDQGSSRNEKPACNKIYNENQTINDSNSKGKELKKTIKTEMTKNGTFYQKKPGASDSEQTTINKAENGKTLENSLSQKQLETHKSSHQQMGTREVKKDHGKQPSRMSHWDLKTLTVTEKSDSLGSNKGSTNLLKSSFSKQGEKQNMGLKGHEKEKITTSVPKVGSKSRFSDQKEHKNIASNSTSIMTRKQQQTAINERLMEDNKETPQPTTPMENQGKVKWKDLVDKYLRKPVPVIGKTQDRLALETNYDSDDDSTIDIFERAMRRHNLDIESGDDED